MRMMNHIIKKKNSNILRRRTTCIDNE